MMETFSAFSMVGVYETRKGLKFVHITSEKFAGKFTVLIFMDNRLTELEAEEWKSFNDKLTDFKAIGAQVVGVCTDSHVTVRTMLMNSASLKGIKFPIICDRDGDFSRAFGVLKLSGGNFGAARAVAVLDPEKRLVHLRLHNERTRARPDSFLQLVSRLQGKPSSAKKPVSFVSNSPTVSFAGSDAVRKNDNVVEIESAKKEEKAKSVTSSKSATRQPADLNLEENQEAEKVPSKAMKHPANCTWAEPQATKAPSNTSQAPKTPGSDTSKTRSAPPIPFGSVSRPGSNLTPSKPSPEVPTNNMEAPSKNQAGAEAAKREAKSTMKTIDNSMEKPPKNLKPAVDAAKADVKKKPAVASNQ